MKNFVVPQLTRPVVGVNYVGSLYSMCAACPATQADERSTRSQIRTTGLLNRSACRLTADPLLLRGSYIRSGRRRDGATENAGVKIIIIIIIMRKFI